MSSMTITQTQVPITQNPPQNNNTGKYSLLIPSIARAVGRLALPMISLFALSNITGAEAGPMAYGACTTLCLGFVSPIFLPACITACLPLLIAPTP